MAVDEFNKNINAYRRNELPGKKKDQDVHDDLSEIYNKSVIDANKNNIPAQSDEYFDAFGRRLAEEGIPNALKIADNYKEAYNKEIEKNARTAFALGSGLAIPYFKESAEKTNAYYEKELKEWSY